MWGASLAPTVAPSRGVAPRRSVSRPSHGLRHSQDTRLRALHLAMPAAAVDVQQATSERARALVQHWARLPDHAWAAGGEVAGSRLGCRRRDERRVGRASGGDFIAGFYPILVCVCVTFVTCEVRVCGLRCRSGSSLYIVARMNPQLTL